jgi:hypothetical protein
MIRAKFKCNGVTKRTGFNGEEFVYDAKFGAVYGGAEGASEENKKFWAATPAGEISVTSVRCDQFEPGQEYYVDFTPAGS